MDLSFAILLFGAAILYSSVGHGGASGYLALMALYQFAPESMKVTALLLNLVVAGVSFFQFFRKGHFQPKLLLYFVVGSIPLAFLGGAFVWEITMYKIVLGVCLLFAVLRMVIPAKNRIIDKSPNRLACFIIGGLIGFVSGSIGIGGGIILSPVILLLGYAHVKQAAAVSAAFIWVNSLAGLMGYMTQGIIMESAVFIYVALAIAGGLIGGYLGSVHCRKQYLQYALSFVLGLASLKLIFM
ncbi:MAG: sulfite exporter TauE/SafE family protein [Cyclobacteriaceae bacterium]|nr:sulfite exporter TauE/SafE family protein [Cyclobacteriaceae bacterium HetDA_MAG_MS6]